MMSVHYTFPNQPPPEEKLWYLYGDIDINEQVTLFDPDTIKKAWSTEDQKKTDE